SPCHSAPRPSRRPPCHLDYLEWSSPEGDSSRLKWLFSRHCTALRSALLPPLAAKRNSFAIKYYKALEHTLKQTAAHVRNGVRSRHGRIPDQCPLYPQKRTCSACTYMGVRAGVSDFVLLHRGHAYALELKAPKGRPTIEQMEFVSDFNSAGGHACIAEGLDRALRVLETWGLLRGQAAITEGTR